MLKNYSISTNDWEEVIHKLTSKYLIYAPIKFDSFHDYELITTDNFRSIIYNIAKPVTPLKSFFLPIKEHITRNEECEKRIVLGAPNCDIKALGILDEIYLDKDYVDTSYKTKRENTLIITTDCFEIQDHCHCTSYGLTPYPSDNFDASIARYNSQYILKVASKKGEAFADEIREYTNIHNTDKETIEALERIQKDITAKIDSNNQKLPDYITTGKLLIASKNQIWDKFSQNCVSCGACATICPTCSCFLLIDKPNFEKVRQIDACQYPGFERVAGDEDPLRIKSKRFKNRYFCKYVWKPEKFKSLACTGCGRCIETCIGKINKNELFEELAN